MDFLKKLLFYGGLEREDFESLLPDARRENAKNLKSYSLIMFGVFSLLFLVQLIIRGSLRNNMPVYLCAAAVSGVYYACVKKLLPKNPQSVKPLMRVFMGVLYLFSFALVFLHKDYPSVTAIVLLLAMPLLFTDRPATTVSISTAATAVFCVLCWWQKEPEIAFLDSWNAVTFVLLSMVITVFQMKNRFHSLYQARKIKTLSETDLLTGAQNRNSFESKMGRYRKKCASSVGCLYADVNGLHELNNNSGHKAGDAMLKAAAEAIRSYFGAEDTYRVGGDEFIAFQTDVSLETLKQKARQISKVLVALGYHVSIGASCQEKAGLDMTELVREAETDMFREKQIYYQQFEHDRRQR